MVQESLICFPGYRKHTQSMLLCEDFLLQLWKKQNWPVFLFFVPRNFSNRTVLERFSFSVLSSFQRPAGCVFHMHVVNIFLFLQRNTINKNIWIQIADGNEVAKKFFIQTQTLYTAMLMKIGIYFINFL